MIKGGLNQKQSGADVVFHRYQGMLSELGILSTRHKDGNRILVESRLGIIDYWPETELWMIRETGRKGNGIDRLIQYVSQINNSPS